MSTENIGKMIKSIDKLIMRNAHALGNQELGQELSPMQGWIIAYLYFNRKKTIYQKDLEQEFGLPKSTLATILKNLDEKGYILRENAEHDSRLKTIVLSEKAMNLQKGIIANFQKIGEYLCEDISQEDQETFLLIGMKMKHSLEKHLKELSNRKESDL